MKRSQAPSALASNSLKRTKEDSPSKPEKDNYGDTNISEGVRETEASSSPSYSSSFVPLARPKFKSPLLKSTTSCTARTAVTSSLTKNSGGDAMVTERFFSVMWRKRQTKVHKTWTAQGYLIVRDHQLILKDEDGKDLGKATFPAKEVATVGIGNTFTIGGKELEIVGEEAAEQFKSGRMFLGVPSSFSSSSSSSTPAPSAILKSTPFKKHIGKGNSLVTTPQKQVSSLYDPNSPGAFVLYRAPAPTDEKGTPLTSVVVEPRLNRLLHDYQRAGVAHMYECVMGNKTPGHFGCILADEMGLGKTLQALTLLSTIIKQGPNGKSAAPKSIVVTPTSLVGNWVKEISKWTGMIKPLVVNGGANVTTTTAATIATFAASSSGVSPVLLISYGQFRIHAEALHKIPISLIICDEGHKLKNARSQTALALSGVSTRKRIILSGTPIQNDLEEFYAMCEFCNPGMLGDVTKFKRIFIQPILNGREPSASSEERSLGAERSKQLSEMTEKFILRRTRSLLEGLLRSKTEQVVFCRLAPLQTALYNHFVKSRNAMQFSMKGGDCALSAIKSFQKLCGHPNFVYEDSTSGNDKSPFQKAGTLFPEGFSVADVTPEHSGKLVVLDDLLKCVRETSQDRVIVVSYSTKVLDLIEKLLKVRDYTYTRLDGSTKINDRQSLVDRFNDPTSRTPQFVFLLSSTAGGVGLNLIGANRLVMFDPDWNPANDQQAMARIWRPGQKKDVWIYRFLSTGTIEERLFQRQLTKQGLSSLIGGDKTTKKMSFTKEELKDLFTLVEDTDCLTHDLIDCECLQSEDGRSTKGKKLSGGRKVVGDNAQKEKCADELASWRHHTAGTIVDPILRTVAENTGLISFCFSQSTTTDVKKEKQLAEKGGKEEDAEAVGNEGEDKEEALQLDEDEPVIKEKREDKVTNEREKENWKTSPKTNFGRTKRVLTEEEEEEELFNSL